MSENMQGTCILIFDKDREWAEAEKVLLHEHGFTVDLECDDFEKCIKAVDHREKMYAMAIINIHALDNPSSSLEQFRRASPITAIVLVMNHEDPQALKFFWPPNVLAEYPFGSKVSHLVGDLPALIKGHLRMSRMLPEHLKITWPGDISEFLKDYSQSRSEPRRMHKGLSLDILNDELIYIIMKLFSSRYGDSSVAPAVTVGKAGGVEGHSMTGLIQITPEVIREASEPNQPPKLTPKSALLKFGPKIDIRQESLNYDKWVEWFLTVNQTVRKIGYAEGNYWAGILYSYPRDISAGYESFAEYIRHRPTADCVKVIERMFHPTNKHWLSYNASHLIPREERRLQQYYVRRVLHADLDEMHNVHFSRQMAQTISKIERKKKTNIWTCAPAKIRFENLNVTIPNPLTFITRPDINELTLTIVHGDLHGQNILIDKETGQYYFIDFFYTGPGHIFRDFIELELSVRYDLFSSRALPADKRLTSINSEDINTPGLKRLIQLEKALISSTLKGKDTGFSYLSERERKAFEIIKAIRHYAYENCKDNFGHYYKGLIFSSLKALKYFYPLDVKLHRLLISGLYIDELQHERIK